MRLWTVKPGIEPDYPDDVVCFEIGDGMLVFVQGDGRWDVSHIDDGEPTREMWNVHGEPIR